MWTKPENDQPCRQFARDVSNMFKQEIERAGTESSSGIEGGASVRGNKGAVMLYGNYDVSLSIPLPYLTYLPTCLLVVACTDVCVAGKQQYDEISRDIFGENYGRLAKLKARYDPTNVFNKLFAIAPDLMASEL